MLYLFDTPCVTVVPTTSLIYPPCVKYVVVCLCASGVVNVFVVDSMVVSDPVVASDFVVIAFEFAVVASNSSNSVAVGGIGGRGYNFTKIIKSSLLLRK